MVTPLEALAKKPKRKKPNKNKTNAEIFRDRFYSFGKKAGTAQSIPGVRGSNLGRTLQRQRALVYPIARGIGTAQSIGAEGNKVAALVTRGYRIFSGSITGRVIESTVRPFNLGPLVGRLARIQLGKALSKNNPIDNALKSIGSAVSGTVKINGSALNSKIRRDPTIKKIAQKGLLLAERNIRAFAPDPSSGQYLIGMGKNKNIAKKYQGGIDMNLVNSTDAFKKHGFSEYIAKDKKYVHRDIFGFTEPGLARKFLHMSIQRRDVTATRGKYVDHFFKGEIRVGGDMFPWIWALEYGGDVPYYAPKKYDKSKKRRGWNDTYTGSSHSSRTEIGKENLDIPLDMYVPKDQYIPPTFFIYRAAERAALSMKKHTEVESYAMGGESAQYYRNWMRLATKNHKSMAGILSGKNKLSYNTPGSSQNYLNTFYRLSDRAKDTFSYMEQRIPGPRVEYSHGNFYHPDLAEAIGIKRVPEDFAFSFNMPVRKQDSEAILKKAADIYVRRGGTNSSTDVNKKFKSNAVVEEIARMLNSQPGRKNTIDANIADATRYVKMFDTYNKARGNVGYKFRRAEYLDKVYDFSAKRQGKRMIITLRKKYGGKTSARAAEIDRDKKDSLARSAWSALEIDELMNEVMGMDF